MISCHGPPKTGSSRNHLGWITFGWTKNSNHPSTTKPMPRINTSVVTVFLPIRSAIPIRPIPHPEWREAHDDGAANQEDRGTVEPSAPKELRSATAHVRVNAEEHEGRGDEERSSVPPRIRSHPAPTLTRKGDRFESFEQVFRRSRAPPRRCRRVRQPGGFGNPDPGQRRFAESGKGGIRTLEGALHPLPA